MEEILFVGLGVFIACVVIQIAVWNCFKVQKSIRMLSFLFGVGPVSAVLALSFAYELSLTQILLSLLLAYCGGAAYMQTYPAFQENIPSFQVLMEIRKAAPQGMSEDDILNAVSSSALFSAKINDLVKDGMIRVESDRITVTPTGVAVLRLLNVLRNWLRLDVGDG